VIAHIETQILNIAQTLYDAWGWLGVAALLAFENATGITPSEIILGFAGWMLIAQHDLSPALILLGGLYAAAGSTMGASAAYWAARLGGRPMVDKLARWARIDPAHIVRVERQFQRWGIGMVFAGRMVPGVRTLVSIPAGLARIPFPAFLVTTFAGAYLWCTLLIGAGYLLGHEWALISGHLNRALPYLLVGGVAALGLYLWVTRRRLAPAYAPDEGPRD
jgi:membrane protein DedA with SNARE-associated domain